MEGFFSIILMLALVVSLASVASAKDEPLKDRPFKERAASTYNPSLQKVELNITKNDKWTKTTYNSV